MKKCLITGATGLIGSHLLAALTSDWQVFTISRRGSVQPGTPLGVTPVAADLSTAWTPTTFPSEIDAVIHLAQSEHFREFPEKALDIFQVNAMSTLRLLDYARQAGARTFVLASSGGVYGHHEQEFSEDVALTAQADLGFYLGTKLCAEVLASNYTGLMNIIVLRFFFVYGPGQRTSMLIPRLVQSVRGGRPITLQGEDGIRINPTYVTDAVAAITRSLTLEQSHTINVGGPEVLNLRQIGEVIGKIVGRPPVFTVQTDVPPRHLMADIQKMSQLLGAPQTRFADGVRQYVAQEQDLPV